MHSRLTRAYLVGAAAAAIRARMRRLGRQRLALRGQRAAAARIRAIDAELVVCARDIDALVQETAA
jgi:hypothetical protein